MQFRYNSIQMAYPNNGLHVSSAELFANIQVLVATNNSEYQLVRPAASYKKMYGDILEQAEILYEVCCLTEQTY